MSDDADELTKLLIRDVPQDGFAPFHAKRIAERILALPLGRRMQALEAENLALLDENDGQRQKMLELALERDRLWEALEWTTEHLWTLFQQRNDGQGAMTEEEAAIYDEARAALGKEASNATDH